jgi:hypothetical protein
MTEMECGGCGSTLGEREAKRKRFPEEPIPTTLSECPHCGGSKCCMCDMGDDVRCISCENGCPNDED